LDVILEALAENDERIVVPLKELKVAPYYGCLLTRPTGIYSPEFPIILEELIKKL
jgi:heterodisulfide reductase subunit B